MSYSTEELAAIYELGRTYFEMGYFAPAERVFHGLLSVDEQMTPARLGLAVLKLERGLFEEAAAHFRQALQDQPFQDRSLALEAKMGLCAAFIALGEMDRAKQMLLQIGPELESIKEQRGELRSLWEAFALRCDSGS